MSIITVIDADGGVCRTLESALEGAGWQSRRVDRAADVTPSEAVIVAAQPDHPLAALAEVMAVRAKPETADVPILLVANLARTGWDRTFDTEGAFQVDAMLDLPVDAATVVGRLQAIFQARRAVTPLKHNPNFETILARAVANEEAAEDFYVKAAAVVTDASTQSALESLAGDEREHKELLLEFKAGKRALPTGKVEFSEKLLETFAVPDLTPDLDPTNAFLLAARKEKLAVEFYQSMAALYGEGPERELLTSLAEIERRHQARVQDMFTNAAFPESW